MGAYLIEESPEYPDRSEGEPGNRGEKVLVQKPRRSESGGPEFDVNKKPIIPSTGRPTMWRTKRSQKKWIRSQKKNSTRDATPNRNEISVPREAL